MSFRALGGGADGLDCYREIIEICAARMMSGAHLVFEIGFDQADSVSDLLSRQNFAHLTVVKDFSGHNRVVIAQKQ